MFGFFWGVCFDNFVLGGRTRSKQCCCPLLEIHHFFSKILQFDVDIFLKNILHKSFVLSHIFLIFFETCTKTSTTVSRQQGAPFLIVTVFPSSKRFLHWVHLCQHLEELLERCDCRAATTPTQHSDDSKKVSTKQVNSFYKRVAKRILFILFGEYTSIQP